MLRYFLTILTVLCMLPVLSQDEDGEIAEDSSWKFQQMPFNYQNIQVPREFWEFMKNSLKSDGVDEKKLDDFAIIPISVQVEISSEDKLILKDGLNHRLLYVEGGGQLDLFNYVVGKGDFYIRFSPALENEEAFHFFYVSDSPEKKVGGDTWGNGCGKIFDLSESVERFMLDQGMKVTSARRQYLYLMAGTYIIFQLVDDRLYLGYIRLTDSRYPQFSCRQTQE